MIIDNRRVIDIILVYFTEKKLHTVGVVIYTRQKFVLIC